MAGDVERERGGVHNASVSAQLQMQNTGGNARETLCYPLSSTSYVTGTSGRGCFCLLDNRACLTLLRVSYQSVACVWTRRIVGRISLREGQLHTGCHLVNGLRPMTTQMDIGPAR